MAGEGEVVVRIGGIVRPEPDPAEGLARIAGDLDESEFAEWMGDYRAGRWLLVCLEMFADVVSEEGVTRRCDGGVRSLYFGMPHGDHNVAHAREALAQYVDSLAETLNDDDLDVTPEELERLPMLIELDAEVETHLNGA
jgi:hypothetical protein